jgi:diguanylate cyclase (GGDEF)-like protein
MSQSKNRWGIAIFVGAAAAIPLLYIISTSPTISRFPGLFKPIIPLIGIGFAVLSFLAGHFSYPRVHNLKVYCAGYLNGLVGVGFGLLIFFPEFAGSMRIVLEIVTFANFFIVLLLPSYCKYRITRLITLNILVAEIVAVAIVYSIPAVRVWATMAGGIEFHTSRTVIVMLLTVAVGILTLRLLHDEFHLGGVLTGTAFLYGVAIIAPEYVFKNHYFETLIFAFTPAFLDLGILLHWFSRMEHRLAYDPLLHIYNRTFCSKIIAEQSKVNTTPPLGIAMVDIDHFKSVNDTHGHEAGDQVLHAVAQAIQKEVVPDGIACRYGGEEIIVFFPKKAFKETVATVEKIRVAVEALTVPVRKKKIRVTVSCGVAMRDEVSQSVTDVINNADKALYRAKNGGRNQVKSTRTALAKVKKENGKK